MIGTPEANDKESRMNAHSMVLCLFLVLLTFIYIKC